MARGMRHTDTTPGRYNRRLRELERQVREQAAAKRASATTVSDGGNLRVKGTLSVIGKAVVSGLLDLTGDMVLRNTEGQTIFQVGDMTYGRGVKFIRDNGTDTLVIARAFDNSTEQTWGLHDRDGVPIVSEEPLSTGLARPRLEHPFQPYAATPGTPVSCGPYGWERESSSDTWETLFFYDGRRQNVFLDIKFAAMCSDATTEGEARAVNLDTGTQLASFVGVPWEADIPTGTTSMTVVDPAPLAAVLPGATGDYVRVGLQVRRTAGTGAITLAVPSAIGG